MMSSKCQTWDPRVLRRRLIPVALLLVLAVGFFAATRPRADAVEAGSWGLSFQKEGSAPSGTASQKALDGYGAAYLGNAEEKVLYLTFDCGYEAGYTASILDTLKEKQVPAAFFVVGTYIESQPELVRRMAAEGHIVGNHTWHHYDMSRIQDPAVFREELESVAKRYESVVGAPMKPYYRPPQGIYSEDNLSQAQELGYHTVFWSLAYVDWLQDQQPTAQQAYDKLLGRVHPGCILLLHATSKTNAEILGELIDRYREAGYRFETLDQLFSEKQEA